MTPNEYLKLSEHTESQAFHPLVIRQQTMHGVIGLAGEAGELLDAIKKPMFYGQDPNIINIKEEVGDCLWYIAQICRSQGWTFEEMMDENIAKLKLRYPNKFTTSDSIQRKDKY